jgi:hypothetical protein
MASPGTTRAAIYKQRDDQKKNAERASGTANDRTHKYATNGMPRSVPCSRFHTRAIVLGSLQEGGRRCDRSKAKNADRASDTAHSGPPAFRTSESEYLLVVGAVKWEYPRTVLKS